MNAHELAGDGMSSSDARPRSARDFPTRLRLCAKRLDTAANYERQQDEPDLWLSHEISNVAAHLIQMANLIEKDAASDAAVHEQTDTAPERDLRPESDGGS